MKILRITGYVSPIKAGITVTEIEAEEKLKTYNIPNNEIGWFGERYIKKENFGLVRSVFRNEIDDRGGTISFYTYCLPGDEENCISVLKKKFDEYMGGLVSSVKNMDAAFKKNFNTITRKVAESPKSFIDSMKLKNKILKTK